MNSHTKNHIKQDIIIKMCERAFPEESPENITELKEGFFNAAYLIKLHSGREAVLKVAPKPTARIQSYEKNILFSEVRSMQLLAKLKPEIPAARILYYDSTKEICESEYFFMEKLKGTSLNHLKDSMTEEELSVVNRELGKMNRAIYDITGEKFGLFGQKQYQGSDWYEVFFSMVRLALEDREKLNVDLKNEDQKIEKLMLLYASEFRSIFHEVIQPRLVHWDLWEANIFVKDGKITGIIDFERCLWADGLMELGFRSHYKIPAFLEGYGKSLFTRNETIRCLWYDIYMYLLMSLEYDYRGYEDKGMYEWPFGMLQNSIIKLNEELING